MRAAGRLVYLTNQQQLGGFNFMENKALFLVALQHELAMAIGNVLDLKAMLKIFLKVCLARLDLRSIHLYLYQNEAASVVIQSSSGVVKLSHFLSIPRRNGGVIWSQCQALNEFSALINSSEAIVMPSGDNFRYGLEIPKYGVIILEAKYQIEPNILKALTPILKKLANSCYASVIHGALLDEISGRKRAERQVKFQSSHDDLTGLYNRSYFNGLVSCALTKSRQSGHIGCAILVGLDRFRLINNTMGHDVSDSILVAIAHRLRTISRLDVNVARLRDDEFIILLPELGLSKALAQPKIENVISQINQLIERPIYTRDNAYQLSCSIGYTLFPEAEMTVNDIIKQSDIAKCKAKRRKPLIGLQYQPYMSEELDNISSYIHEMKLGLKRNEFELYYQPQYTANKKLIGAEALLRWNNPSRGMESPTKYIKIAEESDLIVPIGTWVLRQACQDIKLLEEIGLPDDFKKISVNVSPKQLIQHNFQQVVIDAVKAAKIQATNLGLEITEDVLIDSFDETVLMINYLKSNGVLCSIDDFGTGYSSLTYLKRIPAFLIKIDRAFVANIDTSEENRAIVSMIITLGASLEMDVLAEGVATKDELTCLNELGCKLFQGYYFDRPMPLNQFKELVKSQRRLSKKLHTD
ncbi:MAG: bifunctional diguanylate cyclase/phosphodiesterase [Gammaproteobacteria bacterium]|nr:bifunctional diguanylate cyclase/phosphodiesterase [Gammaproteobacteria bacterium]